MGIAQLRKQLHDYIDTVEDSKLNSIFALLKIENPETVKLTPKPQEASKALTWDENMALAKAAMLNRRR